MAFTIQGIGTTFIGKKDFRPDGSYITTEWIVFIFIPILPFRSFRVKEIGYEGSVFYHREKYQIYERKKPNLKQVLFVYSFIVFWFSWIILFISTLFAPIEQAFEVESVKVILFIVLLYAPALFPFLLRFYAKHKIPPNKTPN